MSRGITVDLIGVESLTRDFDTLRTSVQDRLAAVCRETAYTIRDKAQYLAPRDRGDLADAIQAQGRGLNWRVGITDGRVASRGGSNAAHLNPYVYGVWYELGFTTRRIAARPYMAPAVDSTLPSHEAKVDRVLEDALG